MNASPDNNAPLSFKVRHGGTRPSIITGNTGHTVMRVEAWQLPGHLREAVITEGDHGDAWRVTSDEGLHLKGTDLAPFPFGFFNAGVQADVIRRISTCAAAADVAISALDLQVDSAYGLTGSFAQGTARGDADAGTLRITLASNATHETIRGVIDAALAASPALAMLRAPVACRFALYVNGQRQRLDGLTEAATIDAQDPLQTYPEGPRPLVEDGGEDAVVKTTTQEAGTPQLAGAGGNGRVVRHVTGRAHRMGSTRRSEVESWLQFSGASHFIFRSDDGAAAVAPSGLGLLSAGLAFCYMTQLSRYIEHLPALAAFQTMRGARLVQYTPYAVNENGQAVSEYIDTHVFLDGDTPDAPHAELVTLAARMCFLRAAAAAALPPQLIVVHNGMPLA